MANVSACLCLVSSRFLLFPENAELTFQTESVLLSSIFHMWEKKKNTCLLQATRATTNKCPESEINAASSHACLIYPLRLISTVWCCSNFLQSSFPFLFLVCKTGLTKW